MKAQQTNLTSFHCISSLFDNIKSRIGASRWDMWFDRIITFLLFLQAKSSQVLRFLADSSDILI